MNIDIRTLILIVGITHLMQVLVFTHQYKVNKHVFGPGWWLMWSAAEFLGFGLMLLRNISFLQIYVIILLDIIIFTGTMFVYIGIIRFFEKKVNLKIIIPLLISFICLHLFFVFVIDSISIRTLIFNAYLSIISFLTAYSLYKYKNRSLAATANFNTMLFIIHGLIFAYRTFMIASGTPVTDVFSSSIFNLVQYFDALLIGLLWTFGFIVMLNQKLNSEISEAKLHFEQIFNTSPDAACITRLNDGMFVDCNDGFSRISGFPKEQIIGKSSLEIDIWNNAADRLEVISKLKEKGYYENYESLFQLKSGEIITGLMSGKIISLKGEPHIISVTRDITERKKMEEALRESKEKFQQLADLLPQIVFEADIQGRLTYINKQAYKLFGYSKDENIIGLNTLDFYPPDDRIRAIDNIKKSVAGQKSTDSNEYTMIRKDGSKFKGLVYSNPIIKDGKPFGLRGIIVDITKNKKSEEALRETNAFLENLINYANAPIIVWDPQFRITRFNHAFEHLTGWLESEVLGESLEILFPKELYDIAMALIRKTLTGERWESVEIEILHKTGLINTLLWNSATLFASDSITPIATIAQGHNITVRKQFEEAMKLQNEVLQKLNDEKDKFFSIISHDLKSPFNSIVGFSDLLVEQAREKNLEGIEQFADIILQSSRRVMDLLSNLMEWSRSQTGRINYNPEYFEMVSLINEAFLLLKDTADHKSITIYKAIPRNVPVFADKDMISTVIRNLISNAIKFTTNGGNIIIKIEQKPNELLVSVRDTGVGIPIELQDELFMIDHNQSTQGTNNEKGTGLGLILCKDFVEKHGGKLWVESEEGKGSTFYFTLPQLKV
ncbi:MAG: PAS domain-containing sensor histidine kinase [bacterium]